MSLALDGKIESAYIGDKALNAIYVGNKLIYTGDKAPDLTVPLYFEAANPSVAVTIGFRKGSTENTSDPSGVDFSKYTGYSDPAWSYSYDGLTWSNYSIGNNITIGGSNPSKVYFKSRTNYTAIPWRGQYTDSSSKLATTYYTFLQFTASGGNVKGGGNIQSLLYSDFTAYDSALAYCYYYIFYGWLADYCYYYMFDNCTSLTKAPELPATTLADYCYSNMFYGCTSLTNAPALPATTLANNCYSNMFNNCKSLTSALADYCYYYMFDNCTSLTKAPELPATTLADYCYSYMFCGCTSLTSAPALPATTLVNNCYSNMFLLGIKANSTASAPCIYPYRIPESGTGTDGETTGLTSMFADIDGPGNFTPTINTTFYTSVPVAN